MKGNQKYLFERNRYYPGKMLTCADFQAEQGYFDSKRRFINTMMFGSGVVCGLGVYSLDDLSVFVESGVAIDGLGREIVVENSVVKKLSALEGFESLSSDRASLCLKYREEEIHPVYAVNKQNKGDEYEYNRISEGYDLFLVDTDMVDNIFSMENEFLSRAVLLNAGGYRVELELPSTACQGMYMKCQVCVSKTEGKVQTLSYESALQMPAFTALDGSHELKIQLLDIRLEEGERLTQEYWIKAQNLENADTGVMLQSGSVKAYLDGTKVEAEEELSIKVAIADIQPRKLIDEEIGKLNLEMRNMSGVCEYIRLADLVLVKTETTYIIEKVTERNIKKYIETPAEELIRNEYLEYFRLPDMFRTDSTDRGMNIQPMDSSGRTARFPQIATGTLEIPVGGRVRKGDIRYSGEVMHGLGSGNVYVEVGYEYLEEDRAAGANIRSTVYGNPDLFKSSASKMSNVETAVKVLNDKGSFIVAARFSKDVDYLVLNYRWVAIRFQTGDDGRDMKENAEKKITAKTPTIVLGTKESYYFDVEFHNMEKMSVGYEVTENEGGEITADGVYTAPGKEGVFEIRIFCLENPLICTYAYAIVKKKEQSEAIKE
ncbi:MAG: hypothetical protein J6B06_06265 [Lachnospiraceae bacterium]|nr:hypothetical protein [Lachnospiraceae bacterium]